MNSIICIHENKCLESLYEYLTDNEIIKNYCCYLIFDGLQVLDNKYNISILTPDFFKAHPILLKTK